LAGEVVVRDQLMTKAGDLVDPAVDIRFKGTPLSYVSRGGTKLEGALVDFRVAVEKKIALDVGASTGGFTDCLLTFGAGRVYAVDVGYGQLHWRLRTDPRVVVLERKNVRYLKAGDLADVPQLVTVDVSFISLALVLPVLYGLVCSGGAVLALIKPQFEIGKGKVGKGGVVRSEEDRRQTVEAVKEVARGLGFAVQGISESCLPGPKGNREYFIYLSKSETTCP
jgi:23S rRNA (cytidine1920-2'-O)/16S rRNA (cytidine1409-2'-O)-methyltransferase